MENNNCFAFPSTLGSLAFPPFWSRLSSQFRLAFLSTCVAGLITHLYALTNILLGNDAVNAAFSYNRHLTNGRWLLGFLSDFSSHYQMPVVIGLISIVMIALTAGVTVEVLKISHPIGAVLSGILLVTYPSVACTFAYMYTADAYFIALFMNAAAVWLAKKYRFGWLLSVLLIALACAVYQAYFCYSLSLFLFDCILALFSQDSTKRIIFRGLKYLSILLAAMLLYNLATVLLLQWNDAVLVTYRGMNTIGQLNLTERLAAVPTAWKGYISSLLRWPYAVPLLRPLHFGVILLLAVANIFLIVRESLWKAPGRLTLLVLGWLLTPLAMNFADVLAYEQISHQLMTYTFACFFVFAIKIAELAAERMPPLPSWRAPALYGAALLCCMAVAWNNFCLSNVGYHALTLTYENTYAMANRVVVSIEDLEGFVPGRTPFAIVGGSPHSSAYGVKNYYTDYSTAYGSLMNRNTVLFRNFIFFYTGLRPVALSSEQLQELQNSEAVQNMPVFPEEGSTAMVNGIAVVRVGEGDHIN